MNLSLAIAEHIASATYAHLSPRAVQMTKYSLLDALGVMFGASGIGEGCDAFAQLAIESHAKGEATILGYGVRTSASLAAFVNGAMAHALDFEDAHDEAPVHPNAQVIPAVLALAESLGNVEGQSLITAIAVGCDLTCRLGLSLKESIDDFGWYSPPILSTFGATAAAANLLRLNVRQTLDAFSLALCQTSCSSEIKYNPLSVMRSIRDAFPTQVAVVAAQLARNGVRGFEQPLDGKAGFFNNFARGRFDPELITKNLGKNFEGENLSFKPWPACRGTHAYIDCAQQLSAQHGLTASNIASGHMKGHKVQKMLYEPIESKRRPTTAIDAKFSLPFTVSSALYHGEVTLQNYTDDALRDPKVLELAKRLTFEVDPNPNASDNATRGELSLTSKTGATYTMSLEHPLGHSSRPMSESDLVGKFNQCADLAKNPLTSYAREQLVSAILGIDTHRVLDTRFFALLKS